VSVVASIQSVLWLFLHFPSFFYLQHGIILPLSYILITQFYSNLSANDKLIVEGLKELKRERALPKKQRVLWLKATQDEDSIEEEEDGAEVEYETEDKDETEDEDEYSYGLQTDDPSTDSLLIPFTHSSIPDPRGLYCKLKAEYGEVDCWTCTLCRYDFRYSVQLVSHVQTSKHMDALNMLNPHSSTPNADGDRVAQRLLREVSVSLVSRWELCPVVSDAF
jgi:hypothetical protein